MVMERPLLTLDNVSKYYVSGKNVAAGLQGVSLSFRQGEFVAVTGESGSGKSTLGRIIAGILPYENGEMYLSSRPTSHYDNEDWERYRREQVSFISQDYGILPGATVWDHVLSALRMSGTRQEEWEETGRRILQTVELWDLRDRRGSRLSSGQKQRLAIARALAKPCPILVADEPTGNLDPENSRKVLELLAHASRERLVILITHEFPEAEPYVTRHITLHDGRITADAVLREPAEPEPLSRRDHQDRGLGRYVAALQLRSRPVWSGTVLLCFVVTAFAVFTLLGTFLGALDDTDTRVYSSEAFRNPDRCRIIAVRKDGAVMEQEDYDRILQMEFVQRLEPYGYIRDMYCAYRENVDYTLHHTLRNIGSQTDPVYMQASSVEILRSDSFAQTVPMMPEGEGFLTAGELPGRFDQAVAVGDPGMIGQTVTVYLQDARNWPVNSWIRLDVTVTGVTDQGRGLYLHPDVGWMLTYAYRGALLVYMPRYEQVYSRVEYVDYREASTGVCFQTECIPAENAVLRDLAEDECLISFREYLLRTEWFDTDQPMFDHLYDSGIWTGDNMAFSIMGLHESGMQNLLVVSPGKFRELMESDPGRNGDQVSLTITDYAYTDRVIDALGRAGYHALSPYVVGSVHVDEALASKRVQTLNFSMGALAAVMVLQVLLMRPLFSVQNGAYGILSGIGLSWSAARRSVILEMILFLVPGQLLGGLLIFLGSTMGVERIVNVSKFLSIGGWALVSLVHLLGTVLAGWAVLHKLRREVYPASGRIVDLALEDEEVDGND